VKKRIHTMGAHSMYSLLTAALFLLSSVVHAGPVATLDTESFVGSEKSWRLIRIGYSAILPVRLKEIEGAMPGRFIPKAEVVVLLRMKKGHFLKVTCDAGTDAAAECPDKRNLLEARVVAAAFLESAPRTHKMEELVRPTTWELTPLGRRTLEKAEADCPDLWARLRAMTESVIGTEDD